MNSLHYRLSSTSVLVLFIIIVILKSSVFSQNIPPIEYQLSNSNLGTEFWVAIPQNGHSAESLNQIGIEITVSSPYNTSVTLEIPGLSITKTKEVQAFKTTTFSSKTNEIAWAMEITESDAVTDKGIRISAEKPISVYVSNIKQYSGEGYMAIPVSNFGTEYYHCSYYDFYEYHRNQGGGFIVVAAEKGTVVQIALNGKGASLASAAGGKKIGESYSVNLNEGQTYMIKGDGSTKGVFDLTGTKITSSKPVGIISFHTRTMIPSYCVEDRDNLMEMLPPVNQWGKEFVTVQYQRTPHQKSLGEGDYFRILASEPNTHFRCWYYDSFSNELLGQWELVLKNAGDFAEYNQTSITNYSHSNKSIRGITYWVADKPVLLMQYAYSYPWDYEMTWAPLMVVQTPLEQYSKHAIVQTIKDLGFTENTVTLIAKGDLNDPEKTLLKSIHLNDVCLADNNTQITSNIIPGTDFYWTRINLLDKGTYKITSNTKLAGYVNGFTAANCYGWPFGTSSNRIDYLDFVPPSLSIKGNCGDFIITATEEHNDPAGEEPRSQDQGISKIILDEDNSTNCTLSLKNPSSFKPQYKITNQVFYINAIDNTKPLKAIFYVLDRAGNYTVDSVEYLPEVVNFYPNVINFNNARVNKSKTLPFIIVNKSIDSINITKISTKKNTIFKYENINLPTKIGSNDSLIFYVNYTPVKENTGKEDEDSLFISSDCIDYKFYMLGKGVLPHITLQDWDFGDTTNLGNSVCVEQQNKGLGLKIQNTGSDTLFINNIEDCNPPFFINKPIEPPLPIVIPPKESVTVKSFCFNPTDTFFVSTDIKIISDAIEDSIITLSGKGYMKISGSVDDADNYSIGILSIKPNPVSNNEISIKYIANPLYHSSVILYDMSGKIISNYIDNELLPEHGELSIKLNNISSGTYYLHFINGDITDIKSIIIAK